MADRWIALAATMALFAACGAEPRPEPDRNAGATGDADVSVVAIDPDEADPARWQAVESFSIGLADGPDPYVFGRIEAVDVDRAGRIYVLDGMNLIVRSFDSNGTFLAEMGGPGGGPGEFRAMQLRAMGLLGDSLIAVHNSWLTSELILYDPGGEYHSSIRLPRVLHRGLTTGLADLGKGRLLLHGKLPYGSGALAASQGQEFLLRIDLRDAAIDTLVEFQPHDVVHYALTSRLGELFPRPFPATPAWAVSSTGEIAFGDGKTYTITIHDAAWRPLRRLIGPAAPDPVTEADVDAFRAWYPFGDGMDGLAPGMRRAAASALDEMEFPDTWPAFDRLLYDSEDRLWVRRPPKFGEPLANWDIYDRDLRYVAVGQLPGDVRMVKIRDGSVYGIATDEEGVTSVRVYRLVR